VPIGILGAGMRVRACEVELRMIADDRLSRLCAPARRRPERRGWVPSRTTPHGPVLGLSIGLLSKGA
jgi:hypothetical protein